MQMLGDLLFLDDVVTLLQPKWSELCGGNIGGPMNESVRISGPMHPQTKSSVASYSLHVSQNADLFGDTLRTTLSNAPDENIQLPIERAHVPSEPGIN